MELIRSGRIWMEGGFRKGALAIEGGRISQFFPPETELPPGAPLYDAGENMLLPGAVDLHAHIQDGAETFYHGSQAAVKGGVTTVLDMPPFKTVTNAQQCAERRDWAGAECVCDFGLTGGIVIDEADLEKLDELRACGVRQLKLFMLSNPPTRLIWKTIQRAVKAGLRLTVHMEEPALLGDVNWDDPLGFPRANPPEAEQVAAAQLLEMARAAGAPIHICHVSSARTLDLIDAYRGWGVDVSAETTPHYLILNEDEFFKQPERVVVTPALRRGADNRALWQGLESGLINTVVSDHFLGALPDKNKKRPSAREAEPGIASLELSLPLIHSFGVVQGRLSMRRMVEALASAPARLAMIAKRKGCIEPGKDADLVVFNAEKKWTVANLGADSRISSLPYEGSELTGRVEAVFVRGRMVWNGSEITAERGWGEFVPASKE